MPIYCSWNLLSIHLCFVGGLVATEKLWKLFFASTSVEWDQGQVPRMNSKFDNSGANEYTISEWFSFLMAEKFGNGDWLWPVTVFQPNLKYLHVKTMLFSTLTLIEKSALRGQSAGSVQSNQIERLQYKESPLGCEDKKRKKILVWHPPPQVLKNKFTDSSGHL